VFLGLAQDAGPCSDLNRPFPHENTKTGRVKTLSGRIAKLNLTVPASLTVRHTRYAYVTLLASPSSASRKHHFFEFLKAASSIRQKGSVYDIVVMIYGEGLSDIDAHTLDNAKIKHLNVGRVGLGDPVVAPHETYDDATAEVRCGARFG
jgi:hypothetical protein